MSTRTLLFTDCVDFVGSACKPFPGMKKYVSTGAVDVDHINDSDTEIVDYDGKPSRANLEVMAGDVLFAKMQGTKKTLLINPVLANHIYSTGFCAVRAKDGILTERCLYHLLTSEMFLSQKDKNCSGATQKAITNTGLGKIVIHVPSVEEQNNIADQLDAVIGIITKRQQELSALDDLIKARFVEMFGDMLINPKGLPEKRLDSLANIVSGITKGRKAKTDELYEVPYMAVSNVKDGYIDWTTVKTIMATAGEIDQYRLLPDDVLMTEGGDPDKLGRGAIIHEPPQDCIHQNHIFRVRLMKNVLLSVYMAQYLQQQKAKRYFLGCAKQTTGIASINMRQLSALPVLVPPMKEQEDYAAFVTQVDKSKIVVQKALDEAQLLFDSLMQQYFG